MAVEQVAGSSWNQWPDGRGIRRNELLYAQPNGIPSVSNIDGFLRKRRDVVIGFLRIYGLVYPYSEKAIFVQQALNAFLRMMGEIEELTE